jgi:3-methylfumaryl-CoA hydratase
MELGSLKNWIGRTMDADDIVTPRLDAEFRATFAPLLATTTSGNVGLGLHWCLVPAIEPMDALGQDGHPRTGGFLPPVPLPRRMWAGGEVEIIGALRVGDTVKRLSRIGDISQKSGRSGALCFVAVHHDYETERGLAIRERHDIVYRDAPNRSEPTRPPETVPPRKADLTWTVEPTTTFLFRYSAMTFNGHRIHYDPAYTTQVEGYEGLVVHGPIQATLLLNLAATMLRRVPAKFSYRGMSPLFAGSAVNVCGVRVHGDRVECWTTNADGRIGMEAVAEST